MGMNWINKLLTKWTFSLVLLKRAYTEKQVRDFLSEAGIPKSWVQSSGIGFEI